ncbi:MAG: YihY/virulence factor BrkB family protein [Acidimicrobiia bacterium]
MNIDIQAWLDRQGERFPPFGWALRVWRRYSELRGNQMASSITLTAFLTLFPLALVGIAVLGFVSVNSADIPDRITANLGLTGEAADLVERAIRTAENSRRVASVIGIIGLLLTGLGFAGALAYAYNTAWQVAGRGIKDRLFQLVWLVGLAVLVGATFGATTSLELVGGHLQQLALLVLGIALNVALFLWTSSVLPNRQVPLTRLLPAAIVGGIALEVLKVVGTLVVPRLVTNSSQLYGTLGVVFAILVWLLFMGRIIVFVAVIEVVGFESAHGTRQVTIEVPAIPRREPKGVNRGGGLT